MINTLTARLPELLWHLSKINSFIHPNQLPKGLFRFKLEYTPDSCAAEIKFDLQILKNQKNELRAHYLADIISKKINVLVAICKNKTLIQAKKPNTEFGLQEIATRQKFLQSRQQEIDKLEEMQKALLLHLQKAELINDSISILRLKKELGEILQSISLAKEMRV